MSKKRRIFCIITALAVCQGVPYLGVVWGVPWGVVLSCYVLAVFSVLFTDYTIHKGEGRKL